MAQLRRESTTNLWRIDRVRDRVHSAHLGRTAEETKPNLDLEEEHMNRSKLKIFATLAAAVTALLLSALPASANQPEVTTTIDIPGAVVTVASGINADGAIVGWYCLKLPCNSASTRGFLLDEGVRTDIAAP